MLHAPVLVLMVALAVGSPSYEAQIHKAAAAVDRHDYSAALGICQKAMASEPERYEAIFYIAFILYTFDAYDEAERYAERALQRAPADARAEVEKLRDTLRDRRRLAKYLVDAEAEVQHGRAGPAASLYRSAWVLAPRRTELGMRAVELYYATGDNAAVLDLVPLLRTMVRPEQAVHLDTLQRDALSRLHEVAKAAVVAYKEAMWQQDFKRAEATLAAATDPRLPTLHLFTAIHGARVGREIQSARPASDELRRAIDAGKLSLRDVLTSDAIDSASLDAARRFFAVLEVSQVLTARFGPTSQGEITSYLADRERQLRAEDATLGLRWDGAPSEMIDYLRALRHDGKVVRSLSIQPEGGWIVLAENNLVAYRHLPQPVLRRIRGWASQCPQLRSISLGPKSALVVSCADGRIFHDGVAKELGQALHTVRYERSELRSIAQCGDGWVLVTAAGLHQAPVIDRAGAGGGDTVSVTCSAHAADAVFVRDGGRRLSPVPAALRDMLGDIRIHGQIVEQLILTPGDGFVMLTAPDPTPPPPPPPRPSSGPSAGARPTADSQCQQSCTWGYDACAGGLFYEKQSCVADCREEYSGLYGGDNCWQTCSGEEQSRRDECRARREECRRECGS